LLTVQKILLQYCKDDKRGFSIMEKVYFPRSIGYTGGNINLLAPQIPGKQCRGIDTQYNRILPEPGTINLQPDTVQRDLKEQPNFSYDVEDVGGVDIGFK
jgi:hypothetical protein